MTTGPMGLPAEAFWTDPHQGLDALIDRVLDLGYLGLVLDGPDTVDLGYHATLPLVGVRSCPVARDREARFKQQAIVTAVHLERGEVHAGLAFEWKEPLEEDPPPEGPPSEGMVAEPFGFELRARLPPFPFQPGTVLITLHSGDEVSNRVRTAVVTRGYTEPFGAARPRRVWPPLGDSKLPDYRPGESSPPVPDAPGIALLADRVVMSSPGAWGVVEGSFCLPVLPWDVIPRPSPEDARDAARREARDVGAPGATAVVPVTLVVAGSSIVGPWVHRMFIPVYDESVYEEGGGPVRGHFAVDLCALPGFPRVEQTYRLWALAGEALAGPVLLSLVNEETLAPA